MCGEEQRRSLRAVYSAEADRDRTGVARVTQASCIQRDQLTADGWKASAGCRSPDGRHLQRRQPSSKGEERQWNTTTDRDVVEAELGEPVFRGASECGDAVIGDDHQPRGMAVIALLVGDGRRRHGAADGSPMCAASLPSVASSR